MARTPGTRREIGSSGSATTVPTYGDDSAKPNLDDNTYASMVFFADDLTMAMVLTKDSISI
uniref:Uncharacterized protein n=1 Tax=Oryza barthii TaxID=65489 RepID=A0A0D3GP09_9ORYZ